MYRIVYTSRSLIDKLDEPQYLRDILTEAMRFNQQHEISGVLYLGNRYFLQCLEGEKEAVESVFEKIKRDSRHQEVTCRLQGMSERQFSRWHMLFLRQKSVETALLKQWGFHQFQPEALTDQQIQMLLSSLAASQV